MVPVHPGDVEEAEEGQVDDVTEEEGDEGGAQHQPGQRLPGVGGDNVQLGCEELVLSDHHIILIIIITSTHMEMLETRVKDASRDHSLVSVHLVINIGQHITVMRASSSN